MYQFFVLQLKVEFHQYLHIYFSQILILVLYPLNGHCFLILNFLTKIYLKLILFFILKIELIVMDFYF